jgi:hypothetical protein
MSFVFSELFEEGASMDDTNLQVHPAKVFPPNITMQPAELPLTVREAALYLCISIFQP